MAVKVGSIMEGEVKGITKFGVFVLLPGGQTGLVHISEISNTYVKDINEFLKLNDIVKVKILSVEESGGKIGLSIKKVQENSKNRKSNRGPEISFEDKLSRFLKESDERQQDLKRNTDAKKGKRGPYRQVMN